MRTFVEMLAGSNVVRSVFQWEPADSEPQFNPAVMTCLDVTNVSPQPEVGATYVDGAFTNPAEQPGESNPDPRGFRMAIPLDTSVPISDQSALMADPRAGQFLWALQDRNWQFAQDMYKSLRDAPGTGFTTADVQSLGAMFATYHIPIDPNVV